MFDKIIYNCYHSNIDFLRRFFKMFYVITVQDEQAILYELDLEVLGLTFQELKRRTGMDTVRLAAILDALKYKGRIGYDGFRYVIKKPVQAVQV